jgi:hypothetical protein
VPIAAYEISENCADHLRWEDLDQLAGRRDVFVTVGPEILAEVSATRQPIVEEPF